MSFSYPDALLSLSFKGQGSYSPVDTEELPVDPGLYNRDDMVCLYDWIKPVPGVDLTTETPLNHIRRGFLGPSGFNACEFRDRVVRYINEKRGTCSYIPHEDRGPLYLYSVIIRCVFGIPTEDVPIFVDSRMKTVKKVIRWRLHIGK